MEWPFTGAIRIRAVQQHEKNRDRADHRGNQTDAEITRLSERFDDQRRPKRVTIKTNRSEKKDHTQTPNRGIDETGANGDQILARAFARQLGNDALPLI